MVCWHIQSDRWIPSSHAERFCDVNSTPGFSLFPFYPAFLAPDNHQSICFMFRFTRTRHLNKTSHAFCDCLCSFGMSAFTVCSCCGIHQRTVSFRGWTLLCCGTVPHFACSFIRSWMWINCTLGAFWRGLRPSSPPPAHDGSVLPGLPVLDHTVIPCLDSLACFKEKWGLRENAPTTEVPTSLLRSPNHWRPCLRDCLFGNEYPKKMMACCQSVVQSIGISV